MAPVDSTAPVTISLAAANALQVSQFWLDFSCKFSMGCLCVDYRGYGCNDASVANSDALQLASTLLLVLSNGVFIAPGVVAWRRRLLVPCMCYFYVCIFSALYHLCDSNSRYTYCILPFEVLGYCDFFGAIMAVWVTIVAMTRLTDEKDGVMYMLAAFSLSIGVAWDR